VGAFVVQIAARPSIVARAMEFLILTAARTSEVTGAKWSEIDLKAKVWTIPADRMKGGREHRVPLSTRLVTLLENMPREGDHIFPGGKIGEPMSNMAMAMMLKRMGRDDITVHGFRSTFRDWAAERTNYAADVVEQALAHSVGNKVERAYRRGDVLDKRRRMMDEWANYCGIVAARQADNVTSLRGERRRA
jgi:integrase